MKDKLIYYNTGKRDSVAEILMLIRQRKGDMKSVILEITDQLLRVDKKHPHALWVKKNII